MFQTKQARKQEVKSQQQDIHAQGPQLTADNRGLGSAILFHETSGIGPEPMLFGDGTAVTHPGATDARVSYLSTQKA